MAQRFDVAVVGAGMAGASAAYFLSRNHRVVVLERESHPGYHTTGRSAALYSQTYGNATIRSLTRASWSFFNQPPAGFSETPLLSPRGAVFIGEPSDEPLMRDMLAQMRSQVPSVHWLAGDALQSLIPVLKAPFAQGAIYEPDAMDMDVHAIHQGFLRGARGLGAQLYGDAPVLALHEQGGGWLLQTPQGEFRADVVVNAAGAWCDELARLAGVRPIGLTPKRRTAFLTDAPEGINSGAWPAVIDAQERFYFKPDAGLLLMSPANEDPMLPQDVQAEELDIALAVDRIENATALRIRRVQRKWAGLRSFVADKTPAVGFDDRARGFFWLAGQGGYGIQTAPAMGLLAATLVKQAPLPASLSDHGVEAVQLAVTRPTLDRRYPDLP